MSHLTSSSETPCTGDAAPDVLPPPRPDTPVPHDSLQAFTRMQPILLGVCGPETELTHNAGQDDAHHSHDLTLRDAVAGLRA